MTIDKKKNCPYNTMDGFFKKKNSSYYITDNQLLQHNHGLWPEICHLIFNYHLLFKVKIKGKGESTVWGTPFGRLWANIIICTIHVPLKVCAFCFGFHFWCLGLTILNFTKVMLFTIIWKK